jgi:hypothetical protein
MTTFEQKRKDINSIKCVKMTFSQKNEDNAPLKEIEQNDNIFHAFGKVFFHDRA